MRWTHLGLNKARARISWARVAAAAQLIVATSNLSTISKTTKYQHQTNIVAVIGMAKL